MNLLIALTALVIVVSYQSVECMDTPAIYVGPRRVWGSSTYRPIRHYVKPRIRRSRKLISVNRHSMPQRPANRYTYSRSRRYSRTYRTNPRRVSKKIPLELFRRFFQSTQYNRKKPVRQASAFRRNYAARRRPSVAHAVRRRYRICPWNKISNSQLKLLLKKLLEEYEKTRTLPYTVKDVTNASVRLCKLCGVTGCVPSRHEVSMDLSIAPTGGCNWRNQCKCLAVTNNPGVKCTAKGTIPFGTENIRDLEFDCDGISVLPLEEVFGSGDDLESEILPQRSNSNQHSKGKGPYPAPIFVGNLLDAEDLLRIK